MVAFVWLFTFMHVHMIPQMSYLSAGKLITFIWLLSTVIFCMYVSSKNKLASLEATLVRNSAHLLTHSLTGVKCRATSVAKNGLRVQ